MFNEPKEDEGRVGWVHGVDKASRIVNWVPDPCIDRSVFAAITYRGIRLKSSTDNAKSTKP